MQTVQQQLAGLKLSGVQAALTLQQQQPVHYQELSFEERLSLLLEQEISLRDKRKIERLTRQARFRLKAELAYVDYSASRQLDKATIRSLTQGEWLKHHQNILITGATGCGKTWLACAFGHHYCQQGMSVFYFRLKQLLAQMYLAQAQGSYRKLLDTLANCSLLLLDDWGLEPLNSQQRGDLLELIDARYDRTSTLITRQLPVANWYQMGGRMNVAQGRLNYEQYHWINHWLERWGHGYTAAD